ncbi:MAG: thioredoxin domain-containing protein [archaeon]
MAEEHEHKEHHSKEEHKIELPRRKRRNNFWMIASGVLFALLIVSMFTNGFKSFSGSTAGTGQEITAKDAGDKALKYVNDVLLQGRMTATMGEVKDVGDLYSTKLTISGQVFDSYITKDGRLLFPQAVDLTKAPETDTTGEEPTTASSCEDMTKTDKPVVEVYYMSYCPYGIQAMKGMEPVAKLMGDKVDIQPHYVVYGNYQGGSPQYCIDNGNLCSMHGVAELNEDIRQACVYRDQKDKFWAYTMCTMNECTVQNIETCWETCADKNGVDKAKVNECSTKDGVALMTAEKALNEKKGVQGSPTIFVNGNSYEGGRAPDQFKENICCGFNTKPTECGQTLSASGPAAAGNCG